MSDQPKPEGPDELAGLRDLVGRFRARADVLSASVDHGDDDSVHIAATESRAAGLRDAADIIEAWGRDMAAADREASRG